jgi:hypothetical protein
MTDAPPFWHFMLMHLFRVERLRLREELWRGYPKSTALRWQLMLCGEPATSELVMYERIRKLSQHLDVGVLLRVAEGLAPVGKPHPKALRDFEETVLRLTDAHGKFIWLPDDRRDTHG